MLDAMLSQLVPAMTLASSRLSSVVPAPVPDDDSATNLGDVSSSFSSVTGDIFDNLANNGYQTGVALVVATISIVAMINLRTHKAVVVTVAIGAFWAGWLGWNTFTGNDNPLFPGDLDSTKLWDIAFTSDSGFLLVVAVACVAAIFLWRKGTAMANRLVLIAGAVLGASFLYNLVEAFRSTNS